MSSTDEDAASMSRAQLFAATLNNATGTTSTMHAQMLRAALRVHHTSTVRVQDDDGHVPVNAPGEEVMHPLSALLFLLDGMAILRALRRGSLTGTFVEDTLDSTEMVEHFLAYLGEMYLGHATSLSAEGNSTMPKDHHSAPFQLSQSELPSLTSLALLTADGLEIDGESVDQMETILASSCVQVLVWLSEYREPSSDDSLLQLASSTLHPYNASTDRPTSSSGKLARDLQERVQGSVDPEDESAATVDQTAEGAIPSSSASSAQPSAYVLDEHAAQSIIGAALKAADTNFPLPDVDASLQATIAQALVDYRSVLATLAEVPQDASIPREIRIVDSAKQSPVSVYSPTVTHGKHQMSRPSYGTGMKRWILSSLMKHYVDDSFGHLSTSRPMPDIAPQSSSAVPLSRSTSVRYARSKSEDSAVRDFFPSQDRNLRSASGSADAGSSPAQDGLSDERSSPLTSSATTSFDTTATHASPRSRTIDPAWKSDLDAAKRNDKLRWLFGEPLSSFQPRRSIATARVVPVSAVRSYDLAEGFQFLGTNNRPTTSMQGFAERKSTPQNSPHRRAFSAGSLQSHSSISPGLATFGHQMQFMPGHRQQNSTLDDVASVDSSMRDLSTVTGASLHRVESIDTLDSHTHLLSSSNGRSSSYRNRSTLGGNDQARTFSGGKPALSTISDHHSQYSDDRSGSPPVPIATTFSGVVPRESLSEIRRNSHAPSKSDSDVRAIRNISPAAPNLLSSNEKQTLVKKSRKLRAMLGEMLDESDPRIFPKPLHIHTPESSTAVAKGSMDTGAIAVNASPASTPPDSPRASRLFDGDTTSSELSRDASLAMHRNPSGNYTETFTSPDLAMNNKSGRFAEVSRMDNRMQRDDSWQSLGMQSSPDLPTSSTVGPFARVSATNGLVTKEARRRRLLKVQSFLGERVPASALSHGVGPPLSVDLLSTPTKSRAPTGVLSRASMKINKLTKNKNAVPRVRSPSANAVVFGDEARFIEVDPEAQRGQMLIRRRTIHEMQSPTASEFTIEKADSSAGPVAGAADPTIAAIRRARKLEKVFGSLPPQQLYARKPKLVARDERGTCVRRSSIATFRSGRSASSNSSFYRQSLASLRYVAESGDAQLLNDLAQVVLGIDDAADGDDPGQTPRRQSSKAAMKQPSHSDVDDSGSAHGDVSDTDEEGYDLSERAGDAAVRRSRASSNVIHEGTQEFANARSRSTAHQSIGQFSIGESPRSGNMQKYATTYGSKAYRPGRESVMSTQTGYSVAESAYNPISPPIAGGSSTTRGLKTAVSRLAQSEGDGSHPADGHDTLSVGTSSPRSSMDSVRVHFKRAHKLAKVFGTTKGEIFNSVLDAIEADIAELDEGEELDEDERRDVLEGVAALRASL